MGLIFTEQLVTNNLIIYHHERSYLELTKRELSRSEH